MININRILVIKRNGREERFSIGKLRKSIEKALRYADINDSLDEVIESIINDISSFVKKNNSLKVKSTDISEFVEKALVSKIIENPSYEKAARAYVLGRIYNHVFGKGSWEKFDELDERFTYTALRVLNSRYLRKDPKTGRIVETPKMLMWRVAKSIAEAEDESKRDYWAKKFFELLINRKFIPNSPTLMNAGTKLGILSACFVIPVRDSMVTERGDGIYDAVRAQAIIFQQGGGTGFNFSELRPKGDVVASTSGVASGPLSFMKIFDLNTEVIKQGGRRRGANMGVLHVWHSDIRDFIKAKSGKLKDVHLQNFNISVGVYDYFMHAIKDDAKVPLINPRKTSIDGSTNSLKYAIVWARHHINEEWVQEIILKELEKRGGSAPLDESLIITWDEALAIAESEDAITDWVSAHELFEEIISSAWDSGDPGLLFIDTINRRHPTWYLGKINATNPCVSEDTLILTPKGWRKAKELFEEAKLKGVAIGVEVDEELLGEGGETLAYKTKLVTAVGEEPIYITTNGKELKLLVSKAVNAWVWHVGKKPALKVKIKEGFEITVTYDHKFLTPEGWKKAEELKPGDRILVGRLHPAMLSNAIKGSIDLDEDIAFALGWLIGDGIVNEHYVAWFFGKEDTVAEERIRRGIAKLGGNPLSHTYVLSGSEYKIQYNRTSKVYKNVMKLLGNTLAKGRERRLPEIVWRLSPRALAAFLRGLFTADGYVDQDKAIRLTGASKRLLQEVQILLTTFGITSIIYERPYQSTFNYVTKNGEERAYKTKGYYELIIKGYSIKIFKQVIGFESIKKMEKLSLVKTKIDDIWATVESVENVGLIDFYDFTVPGTHNYIANGLVNHNCGEEPLLEWESCNLGSINLEKYVTLKDGKPTIDWDTLAKDVKIAVRFLDNVISVAKYPLKQLAQAAQRTRKIGLGVMGWAHTLIKLGIPFDSVDALYLAYYLAEWIAYNAYLASIELAKEKGTFPAWDPELYRPHWWTAMPLEKMLKIAGIKDKPSSNVLRIINSRPKVDWRIVEEGMKKYGLRNAALLSIAPTGTISIIAGTSSGIEPIFALAFIRVVTVGTFIEVNPLFLEKLAEYGLDEPEVLKTIAETGTIAHNPFMPKPLRRVFRTAHDIEPIWHVLHQAVWQQWVDAGVSKTVNMRAEATKEDVRRVYILAWALGCKGITIYRDKSKSRQVIYFGVKLSKELVKRGAMVPEKESISEKVTASKPLSELCKESSTAYIVEGRGGSGVEGRTSSEGARYRLAPQPIKLKDGDIGDCSTCEY